MKRKRRLTPIKETPKRTRRRTRSKETTVQTGKPPKPPKRQRRKPVKQKRIKSVFYLCTKTLKDGNGKACFIKGNEYLLQRKVDAKAAELSGLVLRSEVWGHHLVYMKGWGQYFKKSNKVEMLLPEERQWVDPRILKWQEDTFEFLNKLKDNEEATEIQGRVINHLLYGGDRESVILWQRLVSKYGKEKLKRSRKKPPTKKKRRRRIR